MQEYRTIHSQRANKTIKQGRNDHAKMAVSSCYTPLPPLTSGGRFSPENGRETTPTSHYHYTLSLFRRTK